MVLGELSAIMILAPGIFVVEAATGEDEGSDVGPGGVASMGCTGGGL